MIQIPTSYTISIISSLFLIYNLATHNHTDTFNCAIILCISGCLALGNIFSPEKKETHET